MAVPGHSPDPFAVFLSWYEEAEATGQPCADAMVLATITPGGEPAARVVLYKALARGAVQFFTNYDSPKAHELEANPKAALVFHWPGLVRQIRIGGRVTRTTREVSEDYFRSRPRGSQIAACASAQSQVIASREILETRVAELEQRYEGQEVPCPPGWGGYQLTPEFFEFWIGRESRLHDRFVYRAAGAGWLIERLAP